VYKDGQVRLPAYLDDHAFLIDALVEMLQGGTKPADISSTARGSGLPLSIEFGPLLSGELAGEREPFTAAAPARASLRLG